MEVAETDFAVDVECMATNGKFAWANAFATFFRLFMRAL
jgi:hypothetical protein